LAAAVIHLERAHHLERPTFYQWLDTRISTHVHSTVAGGVPLRRLMVNGCDLAWIDLESGALPNPSAPIVKLYGPSDRGFASVDNNATEVLTRVVGLEWPRDQGGPFDRTVF
jgi:hypothetical protein